MLVTCVDDAGAAVDIGPQCPERVADNMAHSYSCSQMEDRVGLCDQPIDQIRIENAASVQAEIGMIDAMLDILFAAGAEIVEYADRITLVQQCDQEGEIR